MARRIAAADCPVFLPADFYDLSGRTQVLRALGALTKAGTLLRFGRGVYVRATINSITGNPMADVCGGFGSLARMALTRLGVPWQENQVVKDYMAGATLQIPVNTVLVVPKRYRRPLALGNMRVQYADY